MPIWNSYPPYVKCREKHSKIPAPRCKAKPFLAGCGCHRLNDTFTKRKLYKVYFRNNTPSTKPLEEDKFCPPHLLHTIHNGYSHSQDPSSHDHPSCCSTSRRIPWKPLAPPSHERIRLDSQCLHDYSKELVK